MKKSEMEEKILLVAATLKGIQEHIAQLAENHHLDNLNNIGFNLACLAEHLELMSEEVFEIDSSETVDASEPSKRIEKLQILSDVHHKIILQVEGGEALCGMMHGDDETLGTAILFENILKNVKDEINFLDSAHLLRN